MRTLFAFGANVPDYLNKVLLSMACRAQANGEKPATGRWLPAKIVPKPVKFAAAPVSTSTMPAQYAPTRPSAGGFPGNIVELKRQADVASSAAPGILKRKAQAVLTPETVEEWRKRHAAMHPDKVHATLCNERKTRKASVRAMRHWRVK